MDELNKIKLIFALGNPKEEFLKTFHNSGFIILDSLLKENDKFKTSDDFSFFKESGFVFAKSSVYMNQSGQAVLKAVKFFKLKPENLLLLHDDSDLELGKIKISFGKNSAGHKGVESVIKHLKTKDFWRGRIGIRKNSKVRKKAEDFVLKKISDSDLKELYFASNFLKEKLKLNSTSGPA
ncbi:MAG: aminoacyl-tRNA hydrolase [Candidatus Pacebacteria bacterium]|nr:aminoacyl-tRNA hydrolase [Candidatus Paceibacterota bacterium]